ncbi:hypothetical protein BKA93DRAFT_526001 [Sparassis latifolia]|uniref:Carboxymuconolactone decarboxylase-like domain-containing protein n=1 Tax=Sparassis crispa TaxID=139825 RepID=A0A401GKR8_9APHY|nr:hypothetical protein SCP_0411520 [Sparassis crispa]GBE82767.1 hypothetical protein SCP_0411520 [Sparassis crispa]
MAHLATTDFLQQLKAIYPSKGALTPETVLSNPWYLVAAVAFSASNKAEAVPLVFAFVLSELKLAQGRESETEKAREQQLRLARRIREALLQSGVLTGIPRVIDSCIALNTVMPEDLRDSKPQRNTKRSMEDLEESGRKLFHSMYRDTADGVQSLLDSAYQDLGWWCNTIGYGVTYGGTTLLTQVETSFTIVAALIAVDAPRQIVWHLANAQHGGATLEEAKAVRQIAMTVAEKSGVVWKAGVPEAI